ncbi:hypothetical protein DJ90_6274 [Paenibacillus macerans]|uniref:Uncharacterized protein n=1 Tax=Paenibacillus macerans TaxID=44252 RepID=A0A090XV09_PAEMA|nr:hypothetical protein DJ90_6274 [Paenibacillus macerans]
MNTKDRITGTPNPYPPQASVSGISQAWIALLSASGRFLHKRSYIELVFV